MAGAMLGDIRWSWRKYGHRGGRGYRRGACAGCDHYTLDRARTGDELEIIEVGDEHARVQALRFGMCEGACVTCVTRIPAGPLVLRSGRQEIAVGRNLAKRIRVRRRDGLAHAPSI